VRTAGLRHGFSRADTYMQTFTAIPLKDPACATRLGLVFPEMKCARQWSDEQVGCGDGNFRQQPLIFILLYIHRGSASSRKGWVSLAITDSWFRELLCAPGDRHSGILACEASNCRFSLFKGENIDYSAYDGLLQYSGDIMPPFVKPGNVSWFRAGYLGAEPEDAYVSE
jgi:hypothetical protein